MADKKYTVESICPTCGKKRKLELTANDAPALEGADAKALEQGQAPKALAQCDSCGHKYAAPISADTCAEWDDFCNAIHPIQEV